MVDDKLVKNVQTSFSIYGLTLSRKLSISLARQLLTIDEDGRESWLTEVVEQVLTQNLSDPHVDIEHLKIAIKECTKGDALKDTETKLNVINACDIPKVKYDLSRKKFLLENVALDLYSEAEYKASLFKDRFEMIWYRTLRHELFTPPKLGEKSTDKLELVPIEYLLSESKVGDICVVGLLEEFSEGQYYLEDAGGTVELDLKETDGLIVIGSIALVNGVYEDGILQVKEIGFPPPESSSNARADFGDANTFGGPHPTLLKLSEKLKTHEENDVDGMIIFVSDLYLDDVVALDKFKVMLDGFSNIPPIAFVLCGHFLSFPPNVTSTEKMKKGFKKLAEIIIQYPNIKESSKFIFVPGPCDLWSPKILPRNPLPRYIVEDFSKDIPDAIFATNPCRIQYCTKEIVVFREDILMKMCRNTLRFPSTERLDLCNYYAKAIICQSHLAPMSFTSSPVYWKYDHALQLYPTPDLIVVADQHEAYSTNYSNCHVINPGSFPRNNFSFKSYVPASDTIDDCEIPTGIGDS